MNADTNRDLMKIFGNGYCRQSQTLGEGGWSYFDKHAIDWKCYILWADDEKIEEITARDDDAAVKAFSGLYHLEMFGRYEIAEKIITYRTVKEN